MPVIVVVDIHIHVTVHVDVLVDVDIAIHVGVDVTIYVLVHVRVGITIHILVRVDIAVHILLISLRVDGAIRILLLLLLGLRFGAAIRTLVGLRFGVAAVGAGVLVGIGARATIGGTSALLFRQTRSEPQGAAANRVMTSIRELVGLIGDFHNVNQFLPVGCRMDASRGITLILLAPFGGENTKVSSLNWLLRSHLSMTAVTCGDSASSLWVMTIFSRQFGLVRDPQLPVHHLSAEGDVLARRAKNVHFAKVGATADVCFGAGVGITQDEILEGKAKVILIVGRIDHLVNRPRVVTVP